MKLRLLALLFIAASAATLAHAQSGTVSSGCDSSPENPTAILALVGGGIAGISALRDRMRRK